MNDKEEIVVLVDENGKEIGLMSKLEAHIKGELHRAFSVFIFNKKGELLLQKRSAKKYHSPNLWTNTCCSHPRENEEIILAGKRRLLEEMGFECELQEKMSFIYKGEVGGGLIEHEYDTILIGEYDGEPIYNKNEVSEYKWIDMKTLRKNVISKPEQYTVWFRIILNKYQEKILE